MGETKICKHVCKSNCRREGCNCLCGEFHVDEVLEKETDGACKYGHCEGSGYVTEEYLNVEGDAFDSRVRMCLCQKMKAIDEEVEQLTNN